MNFDAAEVSLLGLFSLVICVEFFQSSACTVLLGVVWPCQLRAPGQNQFSRVSFWATQLPELFSLSGQKRNGKSGPRPDAVGWDQKCWFLAADSHCHTESAQGIQMTPSGGRVTIFLLIVFSHFWCYLPSLFEPMLLLKTMILLLLFTITALSGIHFIWAALPNAAPLMMQGMFTEAWFILRGAWWKWGGRTSVWKIESLLFCVLTAWQGS